MVDTEFVVNQATFYLTLLITIGSAGAIIAQVIKGIDNKIKRNRLEALAKTEAVHDATKRYVDDKMLEVAYVKERVDYIYRKLIDEWFKDGQQSRP